MTILFWLLAAAMLLVALALLLPALAGGRQREGGVERDTLNIAVFRDQLVELEADHAEGTLSDAQFEAAKRELQRELLDEVGDGDVKGESRARVRLAVPVVALLVPLLAVGLYLQLGESHLLTDEGQAELAQAQQEAHDMANVEQMVQQLATRLQRDPDNLEGWQMLGRSLLATQRYADAAQAFGQAIRIAGEQPDLLADYAEALAMASDGQLLGDPLALVEQVLAKQPMHEKGLWLAGIAAFQRGDFNAALEYWQRLNSVIPEGHPNRQLLADYMAQARSATGGGAVAAAGEGIPAAANASLEVTVDLDPALAGRLADGDTLFVFARAASGPRMPLAIVRRAAGDFPVTVTLDDSQAMMPSLKLSNFSEVSVGARVSRSGNATAQPGDLEGRLDGVLIGADGAVTVTVSEVVGEGQAAAPPASRPTAPAASSQVAPAAVGLEVAVTLDPALVERVAPGDTLFVFARAAQGPRMPLAIVRRQAGELPLTVTLDDSQAMAPNFRLSAFPEVHVGARISKSGDATPQPGDLQGGVTGVRLGETRRIELTISESL